MKPSSALFLSSLAFAATVQADEAPAYLGAADCRIAQVTPAPAEDKIAWSGACKDGYAEGKGTLEWKSSEDRSPWKIEGALARGEISGEATRTSKGGTYIGTFRNGVPHGAGYFRTSGGYQYEGGVVNGRREGKGTMVDPDGSRYDGDWKDGERSGKGKATFALGGSYDGSWHNDQFNGRGRIVYAGSGHVYEGDFLDGRPVNAAPLIKEEAGRFSMKRANAATGSKLRDNMAYTYLPPAATWEELTPGQQDLVRASYPALEPGDEPPYPLKGSRVFLEEVSKVSGLFPNFKGNVALYITVDAKGAPTKVQTVGVTIADLNRALSVVALSKRFKPALCRGQACEMIYPINLNLNAE